MQRVITLTDLVYTESPRRAFDRFLLRFIADERDLVFLHLMMRLAIIFIPPAVYLFIPGNFSWWIAAPYLALNFYMLGPYILMLHCTSHRRLFKKEYDGMNRVIPWLLGPFFGETPETYFGHHLGMHHPENNLDDDLSSTMRYQRDSFPQFMLYFARFFFLILPEIALYFKKKNRPRLLRKTLLGELSWYALVIALAWFNFQATLAVFITPFLFTRFMMMAGNWGQHAFIDLTDPANCYRNSITCIKKRWSLKGLIFL